LIIPQHKSALQVDNKRLSTLECKKVLKKSDMQKNPFFQTGNNRLENLKQILHFQKNQSCLFDFSSI